MALHEAFEPCHEFVRTERPIVSAARRRASATATSSVSTSAAGEKFNAENAARISALTRAHEKIRADLAAFKSANPAAAGDKSLDDLLREFAGNTRTYWAR